jgi:hypothetical protein
VVEFQDGIGSALQKLPEAPFGVADRLPTVLWHGAFKLNAAVFFDLAGAFISKNNLAGPVGTTRKIPGFPRIVYAGRRSGR